MLYLTIPKREVYNTNTEEFEYTDERQICLEHSLVSISKWESKYHKPFFAKEDKTTEELLYYIKCMTLTQNVPDSLYNCLGAEEISKITEYMQDSMTATIFSKPNENAPSGPRVNEFTTSETIYYWMISCEIPFECQKWHINRLFTLIRFINIKNNPGKKMSPKDLRSRNRNLNAMNRKRFNSRG